jgi:hypothetical protein
VFFVQAGLDLDPAIYTFHIAGMTDAYHCTQSLVKLGFHELFAQAATNHNLPDLSLLSSWDHKHESLYPASKKDLLGH